MSPVSRLTRSLFAFILLWMLLGSIGSSKAESQTAPTWPQLPEFSGEEATPAFLP